MAFEMVDGHMPNTHLDKTKWQGSRLVLGQASTSPGVRHQTSSCLGFRQGVADSYAEITMTRSEDTSI